MDDYIWLTERARRREAAWAMTGSLLTHAIMLFILTFTDVTLPLTGMAGKKLDIIWLSPLSLNDQPLEQPEVPKVERQTGPRPKAEERETAGDLVEVGRVAAFSAHVNAAPPLKRSTAAPGEELVEEPGALQPPPPAGPADAAVAKDPGGSGLEGVSRVSEDREREVASGQGDFMAAAVRGATDGHAPKQASTEVTRPERTARQQDLADAARPDDRMHQAVSGKSGVKATELPPQAVSMQKQLLPPVAAIPPEDPSKGGATVAMAQKHESLPSAPPATAPVTVPAKAPTVPAKAPTVPATAPATVSAKAKTESSKKPDAAGIVYPSVTGDLKLVIARSNGARLLVAFRELPRSKRSAPQTRAQAGVQKQVIPIYYKTEEGAAEAVIKTAQEGVYTFRVEEVTPRASVTLRLFEGSAKEKAAPLRVDGGTRGQVLVKILMPEGILWNDDAAFTGSLQDSSSITKFNTETGLYWREYND